MSQFFHHRRVLFFLICFCWLPGHTTPLASDPPDSPAISLHTPGSSTTQQALDYIATTRLPDSSIWWPNVKTRLFLDNLKANILTPLAIYQGSNTNFCGYAALSYLPLHDDPLGYVRFLVALYTDGKATWGNIHFDPSPEIHLAAGTLRFKGILDIRPADQMWFLILADHFRSYLNLFFRRCHPGSENTFWAACNYGKFNRIIRDMFGYNVHAKGSDLIRPPIAHLVDYISRTVQTPGVTFLYVNNTYLHKKDHARFKGSFPTHYIVLQKIWKEDGQDDMYNIVYWDYGGRTLRQVTGRFLKKIVFGISHCTKETPPLL
jgi:hypothetical protein